MLKETLTSEVHGHPHDFEYSTTAAEDDFEAVHTDPLPVGELSDSYIEVDGASESGQTADIISSSDQSDAETIASIDEEDHTEMQPQDFYRIFTPSESRTGGIHAATTTPTCQQPGLFDQDSDEADKGCKNDQSQITVRAAETGAGTDKKGAQLAGLAQLAFPDPSDLPISRPGISTISTADKTPNDLEKRAKSNQSSTFGPPVVPSGILDGRKSDPATSQNQGKQTDRSTKTSTLVREYFGSNFRSRLLQLAVSVLLTFLLVGFMTPLKEFTWALPGSSALGPPLNAQDEMSYRHEQLGKVLTTEGFTGWEGKQVDPTSVLRYPKSYVFGDQGTAGFQYTFQTGVNIHFAGHDQMFVALPKDVRRGKYLVKPTIEVRCFGETIPIANQRDLIPGLTYVRLDTALVESIYQVHVRAGHIDTTVVAGSYRTLGPPGEPRIPDGRHDRTFGGTAQVLAGGFRQIAERLVATSARVTNEIQRAVRQSSTAIGGDSVHVLLHLPARAGGWLSAVGHGTNDALFSKYEDVTRSYGKMKEDLASTAAAARKTSQNIVMSLSQTLDGGLTSVVDTAGPALHEAVHNATVILARARRNGRGLLKRVHSVATEKGRGLSEKLRLHYKAETCQKSCKECRYSCGKTGRRSGKHGH